MCRRRNEGASKTRKEPELSHEQKESAISNLSNTRVANEEELEEIVVFACMHGGMERGEDGCYVTYKSLGGKDASTACRAVHVPRPSRPSTHPHWPDSHPHRPSPAALPVCLAQSTVHTVTYNNPIYN